MSGERRFIIRFRDYAKRRLDRRYSLTSDVDEIRREVDSLSERYATAGEFDLLRREMNALKAHPDGASQTPATPPLSTTAPTRSTTGFTARVSTAPPQGLRAPQPGKLAAIDYAVEYLRLESFADLGGIGEVHGQYSFHMMAHSSVKRGILADLKINDSVREQATQRGLRCVDGDFTKSEIISEIGTVDAVLIFDVLLHTVAPDWDELIALYADSARCFIIGNPQWTRSSKTVRLIELGREGFLDAVPRTKNHNEIFDRLDEWLDLFDRPYRDAMHIWQWGVTDADLIGRMADLGFRMDYYARLAPFWDTNGFVNTSFVFSR